MAKQYITNNHTTALDFPVKSGGLQRVEPGATEYFELLDPDSKQMRAWCHVSMIFISDKKPEVDEKAGAVASAVVGPTQSIEAAAGLAQPSSGAAPAPAKSGDTAKS